MLEDYLSIQLNNLEQEIAKAKKRIEENNHMLSEAAIHAKELSSKLDPSMEVFSPLRVNDTIKKIFVRQMKRSIKQKRISNWTKILSTNWKTKEYLL